MAIELEQKQLSSCVSCWAFTMAIKLVQRRSSSCDKCWDAMAVKLVELVWLLLSLPHLCYGCWHCIACAMAVQALWWLSSSWSSCMSVKLVPGRSSLYSLCDNCQARWAHLMAVSSCDGCELEQWLSSLLSWCDDCCALWAHAMDVQLIKIMQWMSSSMSSHDSCQAWAIVMTVKLVKWLLSWAHMMLVPLVWCWSSSWNGGGASELGRGLVVTEPHSISCEILCPFYFLPQNYIYFLVTLNFNSL
jgi:hypothetical protein